MNLTLDTPMTESTSSKETGYEIFLMLELARLTPTFEPETHMIAIDLEYDRSWDMASILWKQFENSEFNNPNINLYDAIQAFLLNNR